MGVVVECSTECGGDSGGVCREEEEGDERGEGEGWGGYSWGEEEGWACDDSFWAERGG